MRPQSRQNQFSIDSNTHNLLFTYFPQHIYMKSLQKNSQKITQGYFLEETLPHQVKQECEKVKDLFEFLSTQKQTDMEVNGNDFRFKIVRIKKERWYNLNLSVVEPQQIFLGNQPNTNINLLRQRNKISLEVQKKQLQLRNNRLSEKINFLKKSRRNLQQVLLKKEKQINKLKLCNSNFIAETNFYRISQNLFNLSNYKPLKLQVDYDHPGSKFYSIKNSCINKISKELTPLIFKNAINKQARVCLNLSIQAQLLNNWIIFGLITEQQIHNNFCYFTKNSIAFENNLSLVFVELQTLKCEGKLAEGDTLQLFVSQEGMVWTINKRVVCGHSVDQQLRNKLFYPFLILSRTGDTVRVN